jgi:recombination protein RecA
MAKKDKNTEIVTSNIDDIASDLIKDINKEFGHRMAYNLSTDEAPMMIKRWIPTGSRQLDYMIRNAKDGGLPEGRIIELSGLPSTGKTHIACAIAANIQKMGGLVVYIDTESALLLDKLHEQGVDIKKRFVYVETSCTEEVFAVAESTILKAKQASKDVPILIVWDSVAQTSPKAELEGEYDQQSMGLQARVISKGIRKISGVIANNNVTFLCLNQLREAIGVLHGDPYVSPGGKGIPFASSVRIRLGSGNLIKDDKTGVAIGSHVTVTLKKNKIAPNGRKCEFDIFFGRGIVEYEYIFDEVRASCADKGPAVIGNETAIIEGTGTWKVLLVRDAKTEEVKLEKKFYKGDFDNIMKDPAYKKYCDALIERAYVLDFKDEDKEKLLSDGDEVTTEE